MGINFAEGKFSPKAIDFLNNSNARLCILHGSVRSSKTVNCTVRWLDYIVNGPKGDLVMMGKDRGALWRNVLNDMLDLVGKKGYKWVDRMRGELTVFDRRIWIIGASTVETEERLRGSTFAGAYCDEANTYPEVVWNQLMARLSIRGAQVFANCNPDTPHHWFYKGPLTSPEITNRKIWHFTMDDNPNLDEDYKKALISEYKGSPTFYRRFVLGEWVVAEGAIYKIFQDNEEDFTKVSYNRSNNTFMLWNYANNTWETHYPQHTNIGIDWGQNGSAHAFVATVALQNYSHLVVLRSVRHKARGTTPDDVYDWFMDFAESIERDFGAIRAVYADSAEQLLINMLKRNSKYPIRNSLKYPIVDRIRATVALLSQRRIHLLDDECETLKEYFRAARYKDNCPVDTRLDDGTYDQDTGDAFEYSFERYMNHFIESKEVSM